MPLARNIYYANSALSYSALAETSSTMNLYAFGTMNLKTVTYYNAYTKGSHDHPFIIIDHHTTFKINGAVNLTKLVILTRPSIYYL